MKDNTPVKAAKNSLGAVRVLQGPENESQWGVVCAVSAM